MACYKFYKLLYTPRKKLQVLFYREIFYLKFQGSCLVILFSSEAKDI